MTVERFGLIALRIAGAIAALIATLFVGFVGYFAVTYTSTTGCEDAGVACRRAHPLLGGLIGVAVLTALISLLALAVSLVIGSGWGQRRSAIAAGASLVVAILLLVAAR